MILFLSLILQPNKEKRLTANQALCHDFLKFAIFSDEDYKKIYSAEGLVIDGGTLFIDGKEYKMKRLVWKYINKEMGCGIFAPDGFEEGEIVTFYSGRIGEIIFPNHYTFPLKTFSFFDNVDSEITGDRPFEWFVRRNALGGFINSSHGKVGGKLSPANNVRIRWRKRMSNDCVPVYATKKIPKGGQLLYYYDPYHTGHVTYGCQVKL